MNEWIDRCHVGDCVETMRRMPDAFVQTCVTSPPYFGLRDYGHAGQIGLEETPAEFVAKLVEVFREVRRVLRDDGTLWLNLGDSYSGAGPSGASYQSETTKRRAEMQTDGAFRISKTLEARGLTYADKKPIAQPGMKKKDLIGIPWSVATALRDPYYTGRIARERDRAWLAAMIDGEGTICGFHHIRADDGNPRTGVHVTITNSNVPLLDEAHRIWPTSRSEHQRAGAGHLGKRATFRWIVHGAENKIQFLREIYPYLIAKKRQAMVAYNMLLMFADAKSVGHSPGRDAAREKRAALAALLSDLNQCRPVDMPSWLVEPPSVFEPGFYLRQEIIWNKPNPMPESVTDRCTKSHEHLFLLAKSERYHCDMEAIKEPAAPASISRWKQDIDAQEGSDRVHGKTNGNMKAVGGRPARDSFKREGSKRAEVIPGQAVGTHRQDREESAYDTATRNRRSVWTVATKPYKGAHFAVYPEELIVPCILAGAPVGSVVLDPFFGSGTTGAVAQRLGRHFVGCELNPAYSPLQNDRLQQPSFIL